MILVDRGGSNRGGAEEARGAHNPEVIGSNPISGTSRYRVHRSVSTFPRPLNKTGMAQGQRAGLITLRSQDRNLLPVPVFIEFIALY